MLRQNTTETIHICTVYVFNMYICTLCALTLCRFVQSLHLVRNSRLKYVRMYCTYVCVFFSMHALTVGTACVRDECVCTVW